MLVDVLIGKVNLLGCLVMIFLFVYSDNLIVIVFLGKLMFEEIVKDLYIGLFVGKYM